MRYLAIAFLAAFLASIGTVSFAGYKGYPRKHFKKESVETAPAAKEEPMVETVYQCPVHPDVVMKKPGQCPKCKKELTRTMTPDRFHGAQDSK